MIDTKSSRTAWLFWTALIVGFGGLTAFGVWSALAPLGPSTPAALPVLRAKPISDFVLTEADGRTVTQRDLLGRVCLVNFVFTRCAGPCPELSLRMRSVQQSLEGAAPSVLLVTLSLDPQTDRPAVLKEYAARFHADSKRWWFLTANDEAAMHRLIREEFLQVVVPATAEAPLTHSEYFVLLDAQSRIRAVYDGKDPASKPKILQDIEALVREHGS